MTHHARKRLAKCLSLMCQAAKWQTVWNPVTNAPFNFKFSFCTLTIPQTEKVEAKWAYKYLLKPFLQKMKRQHGLKTYVWKAELQERGQLHYHITSTCFIPYYHIQDAWNELMGKHGLLDEFRSKFNHTQPHSTEIKSVRHIKNFEAYMLKYMCKDVGNEDCVHGKVWGASDNLRLGKYFVRDVSIKVGEAIDWLREHPNTQSIIGEHYELIKFFNRGIYSTFVELFPQYGAYISQFR